MPSTVTDRLRGLTTSVAVKAPCVVASTGANLTLSSTQVVDGIAVGSSERVLVKDQTDTTANGIYISSSGAWARAQDFDGARDGVPGTSVLVDRGTVNGASRWIANSSSTAATIDIGTTEITFSQDPMSSGSTTVDIQGGTITGITDLAVADGGTGASSFTDGAVLIGAGTGVITAVAMAGDGDILVGDGTTAPKNMVGAFTGYGGFLKPIAGGLGINAGGVVDGDFIVGTGSGTMGLESGATVRTSMGLGTADNVTFAGLTATGNISLDGGTFTFNASLADLDFIVGSAADANALTVNGLNDAVGIGADPGNSHKLYIEDGTATDVLYDLVALGTYGTDPTMQAISIAVDTTAVRISDHASGGINGGLTIVTGGADPNTFTDIVSWHSQATGTPTVIASETKNTPPARTYAHSAGYLSLSIASTAVQCSAVSITMRSN